ncbi:MAG: MFS transporter [Christensenellaceae bacterium]|jgi:PPP family 3-phenylpropionic acid transporter
MNNKKRGTVLTDLRRGGYFYYSLLELLFCASNACNAFFVSLFTQNGIDMRYVGIILAGNSFTSFIFPPIMGLFADKIQSKRKTLTFTLSAMAIFTVLTPFCGNHFILMFLASTLGQGFRSASVSLAETWILTEVSQPERDGSKINFSAIRLWGSLGFSIMCIVFYFVINVSGSPVDITFFVGSFLALIAVGFSVRGKKRETPPAGGTAKAISFKELKPGRLFKNYYYLTFMLVYVLLNSSMGFVQSYIPELLRQVGGSVALVGLVNGIRAFCEAPIMLISPWIVKKIGYEKSLMVTGLVYVVEQFIYLIAKTPSMVLVGQILRGSASGILFSSAVAYIFSLVPRSLSASAQTFAAGGANLLSMIANFLSGFLIDAFGLRSLFVVSASFQTLAVILFMITLYIGSKRKIPRYDAMLEEAIEIV